MSILFSLVNLLLYLIGGILLLNVLYLLLFAIVGRWRRAPAPAAPAMPTHRMCVLIPSYRADAVILETGPAAAQHAYAGRADVQVIADKLQPATVQSLRQQGVGVVEVSFVKSTKGQALLTALNTLPPEAYDVAVILDVDNVMAPGFLTQVDAAFAAGYRVVQGHRTAKKLDSPFAVLDACNEEINNHIFRQGHVNLGMSSALIGSGMAFDYGYLHQLLQDVGETPGEDKELDFRVLRDGHKIAYLSDAFVYDEKIPNSQVFATQRTRWLATQQEFLVKYFGEGLRQLGKGNLDFVDKIVQSALLPRILLLGVLGVLLLLSLLWSGGPGSGFWLGLLGGTAAALLLSLPARLYTWQVGRALLHLPVALGAMVLALLQIRRARTSFMHTPHAPSR
ncbi:glycosyltransferase [Hymenobacter negativus]|uniref:Glycosyltransferase n=1 Tax=Hymenobacter negativus TaxID=2795026 RepID=A0ABS3QAI3_9BACT|nr:glycosyltransferase [Hymenobacter negativus]MBO2008262.1 glycosyltransferase [Hymenobacter negativus]